MTRVFLLRPAEQAAVYDFAEDVSLDGLEHIRARLERVGRRLHVEHRVKRVELEHVMVLRTVRAGAGSTGPSGPLH